MVMAAFGLTEMVGLVTMLSGIPIQEKALEMGGPALPLWGCRTALARCLGWESRRHRAITGAKNGLGENILLSRVA